jgi:hypothetical protein
MSRCVVPARSLLALALFGGLLVSPVAAQPRGGAAAEPMGGSEIDFPENPDPLDVKELARAKYEAVHADPRELARERLVAARAAYRACEEEFLAGRGWLDRLLDNSQRLLEAELAVSDRPGERVAALERNWKRAVVLGHVMEARLQARRTPIADYAEVRYNLLGAEIAWLRARQGQPAGRPRGVPAERFVQENGDEVPLEPGGEQEMARDKREALRADPADLVRQRLEVAKDGYRARFEEFLAGRGTLDLFTDWAPRFLEAELAVRDKTEDQLTAYETYWAQTEHLDLMNVARFAAARIPPADYLEGKYARLDAEVRWAEARARLGKSARSELGVRVPWMLAYLPPEAFDTDQHLRELARAKREALRADPRDLARERLAAARGAYQPRWEEFLAGRGTLDILLRDSERWLASELALSPNPSQRAAAWERQWTRLRLVEAINEGRYQKGRLPIADRMKSRCLRLDAEIHWAETRAAQEKK